MKTTLNLFRQILIVLSIIIATQGVCQPQELTGSQPASTNVSGAQYPRVTSDLKVIFQIKAPDAQKVQIQLGKT